MSKEPPHRPILLDFGLTKKLSNSMKQALAKMFLASAEVCTNLIVFFIYHAQLDFTSFYELMVLHMKKQYGACFSPFLLLGNIFSFFFFFLFIPHCV